MAIVKETIADKIETLENGAIQVRTATILKEGTASAGYTELTRSYHRHVLQPSVKDSGSWQDTDISGEDARVQAICNAVWTADVKTAYQQFIDAKETTETPTE